MTQQLKRVLDDFAPHRICILGAGREGLSTYTFLRQHFPQKHFMLVDQSPLEHLSADTQAMIHADANLLFVGGEAYLDALQEADVLVRSPGISLDIPQLRAAWSRGATITSNTKLFFTLCPGSTIGITGTKGKSTTTALIAHMLTLGGKMVQTLGNIGVPPLSVIQHITPDTIVVAELSSYQLADFEQSPHIAVLLNIVPEHLRYHGSFEAYVEAKTNIVRYQTEHDYLVYNADYPLPSQLAQQSCAKKVPFRLNPCSDPGYFVRGKWLWYGTTNKAETLISRDEISLKGQFNMYNILPALAVGHVCDVAREAMIESIRTFHPLEHRLEYVGSLRDIRFYNDSLSTIPEAAIAAIDTLAPSPIILIAGGYERGLDYTALAKKIVHAPIRGLVLFPPSGVRLWETLVALKPKGLPQHMHVQRMREAMDVAWELAQPGDVILLSPASASFSNFVDYRDRGNQFKQEVQRILTTFADS